MRIRLRDGPAPTTLGKSVTIRLIPSGVDDPFIPATDIVSRLSVADVDIATFPIDTNLSLRVRWTVRLNSA